MQRYKNSTVYKNITKQHILIGVVTSMLFDNCILKLYLPILTGKRFSLKLKGKVYATWWGVVWSITATEHVQNDLFLLKEATASHWKFTKSWVKLDPG